MAHSPEERGSAGASPAVETSQLQLRELRLGFHLLMAYFWLWNLPHRMLLPLTYDQVSGKEETHLMSTYVHDVSFLVPKTYHPWTHPLAATGKKPEAPRMLSKTTESLKTIWVSQEEFIMLPSVLVFDALCAHVRFDGLSSLALVRELGNVCGFEDRWGHGCPFE